MSSSIKDLLDYNIVKKCNKCDIVQIISNFYFRKDIYKYRNDCKRCNYEMRNNFYERKEYSKNYYQNNKEKFSLKKKENNKINREKINNRYKDKRNTNPTFKLTENLRNRTRAAFKSQNVTKNNKTFELIGCSQKFLRDWIQFQLYGEMTMKNYGKVWQIDHTLAINSFSVQRR